MRTTYRLLGSVLALSSLMLAGSAFAEEEFDANVKGAEVKVVAKGAWHINKDFPWKVTVPGDKKLEKERFTFDEKAFSVRDLPKGDTKIVGGVCSESSCRRIEKVVHVD